ncbi:MAG: hypothetical protein MOGMAGMI_01800 [Candidatus Omnitrophica bacterium]|nr:hypothetical protein [Candidatus Omnitrophota bacterium]
MDITKRLLELDPTLSRHNEGYWSEPFNERRQGYSSFNDAGIEIETGEFLYAITRLLKPNRVLETGTHWGIGAAYMGMALKDNGVGTMTTVEFLPEIHQVACKRMQSLGLGGTGSADEIVYCKFGDVKDLIPESNYQLILLDTEPQTRFAEFLKFWDYLDEGGYIFIHDLHRHMHQIPNEEHGFAWPYGKLPKEMIKLVKDGKARPFHFPTPRGLTGFYKVAQGDYVW